MCPEESSPPGTSTRLCGVAEFVRSSLRLVSTKQPAHAQLVRSTAGRSRSTALLRSRSAALLGSRSAALSCGSAALPCRGAATVRTMVMSAARSATASNRGTALLGSAAFSCGGAALVRYGRATGFGRSAATVMAGTPSSTTPIEHTEQAGIRRVGADTTDRDGGSKCQPLHFRTSPRVHFRTEREELLVIIGTVHPSTPKGVQHSTDCVRHTVLFFDIPAGG